jgi:hypothetical protein
MAGASTISPFINFKNWSFNKDLFFIPFFPFLYISII